MDSPTTSASALRESPVSGSFPQFEIPEWRDRYGVTAGITARGDEPGPGFNLGLWGDESVKQVMGRWRTFRSGVTGFGAVVLGNQVHGVELLSIDTGRGWIQMEGVDGWVTTTPGILLTVTVADCVPVYLIVPGRGVALLHAGWRGTASGILARGMERLLRQTGASATDLVIHCGVGICGSCYEVGSEVMTACGVPANGPGPWHLDLREQLMSQATSLGAGCVTRSAWCSAHHRPTFYSHRASGGSDGRMVAYIGMPTNQLAGLPS